MVMHMSKDEFVYGERDAKLKAELENIAGVKSVPEHTCEPYKRDFRLDTPLGSVVREGFFCNFCGWFLGYGVDDMSNYCTFCGSKVIRNAD